MIKILSSWKAWAAQFENAESLVIIGFQAIYFSLGVIKKAQSWLFRGKSSVYFYNVNGKKIKKAYPRQPTKVITSFHMASNR